MMSKFVLSMGVALAFCALAGCTHDPNYATLKGQVIVDGQPAATGSISFIPSDGQAPTMGTSIIDGNYETQVPVGGSKVEIRIPRKVGSRKLYDTPDSPIQDTFEEVLPPKFNSNSKLKFTAKPGANEKDWELSSK